MPKMKNYLMIAVIILIAACGSKTDYDATLSIVPGTGSPNTVVPPLVDTPICNPPTNKMSITSNPTIIGLVDQNYGTSGGFMLNSGEMIANSSGGDMYVYFTSPTPNPGVYYTSDITNSNPKKVYMYTVNSLNHSVQPILGQKLWLTYDSNSSEYTLTFCTLRFDYSGSVSYTFYGSGKIKF